MKNFWKNLEYIPFRDALIRVKNSSLLRATGIYTVTGVINGSIIFFLMPFLTRNLTTEAYGIYSMFRVLTAFVVPFIAFYAVVGRQYYEREHIDFPAFVTNTLMIIFVNTGLVILALWLFSDPVSRISSFPAPWLWAVVIYSIGRALMYVRLTLWQVQVRPVPYGVLQILQTALTFVLAILMVVFLHQGWQGAVKGESYSYAFFGLVSLYFIYRGGFFKPQFHGSYVKEILVFNVPLIFHALGRTIVTMSDRIFITNMVSLSDTGLYSAGYQIGMIVFLLTQSFNNAWLPHFFSKLKMNDKRANLNMIKFTYLYFFGILVFALGLGFISPWFIGFFLGKDFSGSSQYILWIALGFAFNAMYWMVSNYIFYVKKTYLIAVITLVSALLKIVLNYFCIKKYGAIGAAYSTTITFIVIFFLSWIISARLYKMPWDLKLT